MVDMLKSLKNKILQMKSFGRIKNGAIVPDQPLSLPDGTRVEFALVSPKDSNRQETPRQGGQLNNQIKIADDFDSLPSDIVEAFGIKPE